MSDWLWVWIGAAAVFGLIELFTPFMFFSVSFAVGALVAAIAAALDASVGVQFAGFLVGSVAALALLVPVGLRIARAEPEGDEATEGARRYVGRVALVLDEIPDDGHATGLVRLEGAQWRAESDGAPVIPAGSEVEVVAVRGTRLVVAPLHSDN